MESLGHGKETDMKNVLSLWLTTAAFGLIGESSEEAYARLVGHRSVWETNAWAYVNTIPLTTNKTASAANGWWYIEMLQYPDIAETNRLEQILDAKEYAIRHYSDVDGILENSNAWYAVADYIAHLKDVADPRWIDESYEVVTGVMDDGVKIIANTNPLLDFASYKLEHFANFRQAHTNLVNEIDALNAFFREWSNMTDSNVKRERRLKVSLLEPKRTIRECFWWFGMDSLSEAERATVQSNIVERARLSQEESDSIFVEKFRFIPIK